MNEDMNVSKVATEYLIKKLENDPNYGLKLFFNKIEPIPGCEEACDVIGKIVNVNLCKLLGKQEPHVNAKKVKEVLDLAHRLIVDQMNYVEKPRKEPEEESETIAKKIVRRFGKHSVVKHMDFLKAIADVTVLVKEETVFNDEPVSSIVGHPSRVSIYVFTDWSKVRVTMYRGSFVVSEIG
jgi:hypothetical protein